MVDNPEQYKAGPHKGEPAYLSSSAVEPQISEDQTLPCISEYGMAKPDHLIHPFGSDR